MMKRIRRDDEVVVTAGKDKGKRGKVLKILDGNNALVSGIQIVKKHQKPNPNLGIAGGIIEKESPINTSNLALFDEKASKGSRGKFELSKDGSKSRVLKSSKNKVES